MSTTAAIEREPIGTPALSKILGVSDPTLWRWMEAGAIEAPPGQGTGRPRPISGDEAARVILVVRAAWRGGIDPKLLLIAHRQGKVKLLPDGSLVIPPAPAEASPVPELLSA